MTLKVPKASLFLSTDLNSREAESFEMTMEGVEKTFSFSWYEADSKWLKLRNGNYGINAPAEKAHTISLRVLLENETSYPVHFEDLASVKQIKSGKSYQINILEKKRYYFNAVIFEVEKKQILKEIKKGAQPVTSTPSPIDKKEEDAPTLEQYINVVDDFCRFFNEDLIPKTDPNLEKMLDIDLLKILEEKNKALKNLNDERKRLKDSQVIDAKSSFALLEEQGHLSKGIIQIRRVLKNRGCENL